MYLYRIVKDKARTNDLSGTGAFRTGGRWNSKGTYMLYTSENSSLAYLESLVHFDESLYPPDLYIVQIELDDSQPVFTLSNAGYPDHWIELGHLENKYLGDQWMTERKFLAVRVKSAINIMEHDYLLNPLFPGYQDFIRVKSITQIPVDERLI